MSEIKPALTADEWANGFLGPLDFNDDGTVTNGCCGCAIPDRHGLAAKCLHEQPFGFTREMVGAIRLCAEVMDGEYGFRYDGVHPDTLLSREAADRIEALLPPEVDPK